MQLTNKPTLPQLYMKTPRGKYVPYVAREAYQKCRNTKCPRPDGMFPYNGHKRSHHCSTLCRASAWQREKRPWVGKTRTKKPTPSSN